MSYRLIAIDLDGTLLDPEHRLSQANHMAIKACLARDIQVMIATGRLFASVAPYARTLGLDGPQITLNGAVLGDAASGRLTTRASLNPAQLSDVLDTLCARDIPYTIFGPDAIYAEPGTPHLDILDSYGEPPAVLLDRADMLRLPAPVKVLTFLNPGPLDAELGAALGDRVEVVRSGALFLEFLSPGVSKGMALRELMAQRSIPPAEVLAIGDSENDLSMFAVAGMSIAMANAAAHIQARAAAITSDCRSDGVALAVQRYVLG